jgi:SAM-dependent methyltransferase
MILDVGCGSRPKGTVNVDFFNGGNWNPHDGNQEQGEYINLKKIPNYIMADAQYLPFKDEAFTEVISSHTIEHVQNPYIMLKELIRVTKQSTTVRCPHYKGSGAIRPHHLHYFDENWFIKTTEKLNLSCNVHISAFDYPLSNRLTFTPSIVKKSLIWRFLQHVERKMIKSGFVHRPFELEAKIVKSYTTRSTVCHSVN